MNPRRRPNRPRTRLGQALGLLGGVLLATTTGASSETQFEEANRLYETRQFTEAAGLYRAATTNGVSKRTCGRDLPDRLRSHESRQCDGLGVGKLKVGHARRCMTGGRILEEVCQGTMRKFRVDKVQRQPVELIFPMRRLEVMAGNTSQRFKQ